MTATVDRASPHQSRAVLSDAVQNLTSIALDEVMAVAQLQTRTDHKYLLTPEQFSTMVDALGRRLPVLQINGLRVFHYESVYFDTPGLALFHAHRQRRRRRYKVRTRTYLDTQQSMLEVKLKDLRDQTTKHRASYPLHERHHLNRAAREFVTDALGAQYGVSPRTLEAALTIAYSRATLVDTVHQARLTCDVDMAYSALDDHRAGPDLVLVESKSAGGTAPADEVLRSMGLRPVSLSKYCIGMAMLHPDLPANPWNRILRQKFGWTRQPAPW